MAYGKKKEMETNEVSLVSELKERLRAPKARLARRLDRNGLLSVHQQRIESARPRVKLDPEAMTRAITMNVRDLNNRGDKITISEYRATLGL